MLFKVSRYVRLSRFIWPLEDVVFVAWFITVLYNALIVHTKIYDSLRTISPELSRAVWPSPESKELRRNLLITNPRKCSIASRYVEVLELVW